MLKQKSALILFFINIVYLLFSVDLLVLLSSTNFYILVFWKIGNEDTSQTKNNDRENHMRDARGEIDRCDGQGTWIVCQLIFS